MDLHASDRLGFDHHELEITTMPKLSPPELRIICSILIKEFGSASPLLDRIEWLEFDTRQMTGTGYHVHFTNAEQLPRLDKLNIELSEDLRTTLDEPADLVAFTLFVRSGYLSSFEGYTFGDVQWPTKPMQDWLLLDENEKRVEEKPVHTVKARPKSVASSTTDAERRKAEGQLREQLRQDCDEARKIGYNPALFLSMMSKHGPIEACRQVIMSSKIPDGFMRLLELNRLELTAEATVLRGPWQALFSEAVLEQARSRLIAYGREDLAEE